jgi:hypothetical protein
MNVYMYLQISRDMNMDMTTNMDRDMDIRTDRATDTDNDADMDMDTDIYRRGQELYDLLIECRNVLPPAPTGKKWTCGHNAVRKQPGNREF